MSTATGSVVLTGFSTGAFEINLSPAFMPDSAILRDPSTVIQGPSSGLTFVGNPSGTIVVDITEFASGKIRGNVVTNNLGTNTATVSAVAYGIPSEELKTQVIRITSVSPGIQVVSTGFRPRRIEFLALDSTNPAKLSHGVGIFTSAGIFNQNHHDNGIQAESDFHDVISVRDLYGDGYTAVVSSITSDSFSLTWTLHGLGGGVSVSAIVEG